MVFSFIESNIKAILLIEALSQALQAHMAVPGTNPCHTPDQLDRKRLFLLQQSMLHSQFAILVFCWTENLACGERKRVLNIYSCRACLKRSFPFSVFCWMAILPWGTKPRQSSSDKYVQYPLQKNDGYWRAIQACLHRLKHMGTASFIATNTAHRCYQL